MSLSSNSRNVFVECDWLDLWQQGPWLSSLNLIQAIPTDGSFSINCSGLKHLSRFLNKALSFREAGGLLGPPGNYLLKWMWQQS